MSFVSFGSSSREILNFVAEALFHELHEDEALTVRFRGEETDYIRWNQSKVRQNTAVLQRHLFFELHKDQRRVTKGFTISGNLEWDLIEARQLLSQARLEVGTLPPDVPWVEIKNHGTSEAVFEGELLSVDELIPAISEPVKELDFTGFYAGGSIVVGNRNSKGQNHWFSNETFFIDYSLYNDHNAVKSVYASFRWDQSKYVESLRLARQQLEQMNQPRLKINPGPYRVYLAPAAVAELTPLFSMGALSFRALQDGDCAFRKLAMAESKLSDHFSLLENFTLGMTPQFNEEGELAREKIPLIVHGALKELLTSSRSAAQYGVSSNQAGNAEKLRSLEISPGSLPKEHILQELGTGLYLSNLHYANWSDVQTARVTGMTRYACFWVENGKIVAPIEDMRFDVSFYEIFGEGLFAVTDFQEVDPEVSTIGERGLGGRLLPGLLIENFRLTL